MRNILIISLLSFNLAGNAQELKDSAKVHNIDEVVMTIFLVKRKKVI